MTAPTDAEDDNVEADGLCDLCGEREATTTFGDGSLCADCRADVDGGSTGSNPRSDADTSTTDTPHPRERVADRLREADLDTERFIDVHDGEKRSTVTHSDPSNHHGPDGVTGNYGIYANGDEPGGLVDVDVDDYNDDVDGDALAAVNDLPETLTVETPHTDGVTGGHRFYKVVPGDEFETAEEACEAVAGATNPTPSWGEIRVQNQYVVGPGSQLDGCDNSDCDECATPDGGRYRIADDRPIATITADDLADVLRADPTLSGGRTPSPTPTRTDADPRRTTATGADADTDSRESAEVGEDGEHPDPSAVVAATGVAEDYPRDGDRSTHDWAICKEFARHGVPKAAAERWFFDTLPESKVADRDSINYGETWTEAVAAVRREDGDTGTSTVTEDYPVHGSPEPVVRDDGTVAVVMPTHDHTGLRTVALGTWRCRNCGTATTSPVHADSDASDLPTPNDCPGCDADNPAFTHVALDRDGIQTALRANQMWNPPSGVRPDDFDGLWDDVRAFIHDYWDGGTDDTADAVYAGLTAYALTTWVRENLTFVPHLLTLGRTTGGKTRLLNTLARVSYRAIVTASATPASMYRLIDRYEVSYFISEYHGLQQETRQEIDNVVRAGQKRGEVVTRAEQTATGYEPGVFNPFTHVAVATQYEVADDIKNRCIRTRSSGTHRDMPATFAEDHATALRDRLLAARFRLLHSEEWADAEADAYAYLREHGIDGRTREKLLSLVTVALVWDRLDDDFEAFVDLVVAQDRDAAADSEDALFVEAVRDLAFDAVGDVQVLGDSDPFAAVTIPYGDVADRYEDMTGEEKSPSWVGHLVKRHGFEKERKRDGTVIADPDLGPTLRRLCEEHNLDWGRLDADDPAPELPDDEKGPGAGGCSECGRDRTLTHRNLDSGGRICGDCAAEIRAADRDRTHSGGGPP